MTLPLATQAVRERAIGVAMALAAFGVMSLQWLRRRRAVAIVVLAGVLGVGALAAAQTLMRPAAEPVNPQLMKFTGRLTPADFRRYLDTLDPAVAALAYRQEPQAGADTWGRPMGWTSLDVSQPPSLGFSNLIDEDARAVNSLIPVDVGALQPALPFFLTSSGAERERAIKCMTQAIYYEAALEPTAGQEAVAQVVLNRVRHPAYPKTICGVVYQGAERFTGCQFSFTCDGSVLRAPQASYWARARVVAERALSGYVQSSVGTATFYHADYVYPAWGPMLVKLNQIGAHIFYRFPGPAGERRNFFGRYAGNELSVSLAVHNPANDPIDMTAPAPPGFETFTIAQAQAHAPLDSNGRVRGVIAGRRTPTPEEIARINAALGALPESKADPSSRSATVAPKPSAPPNSDAVPIGQR